MGSNLGKTEYNNKNLTDLASDTELEVIQSFAGHEYGPLDFYDEDSTGISIENLSNINSRNFIGGSYVLATPKSGTTLKLYRLYGGKASATGNYWMTEKRDGNTTTQIDYALHPTWGNTMKNINEIEIPHGFQIIFGKCSSQSGFGGGGYQVFIPKDHLEVYLKNNMRELRKEQEIFMRRYNEKLKEILSKEKLKSFFGKENALALSKNGNLLNQLPNEVRERIGSTGSEKVSSNSKLSEGTYVIHREDLRLPNGSVIPVKLSVKIEFSHETRTTTKSGNTTITNITRYYTKTYIWS
jgi:hypothetical protein